MFGIKPSTVSTFLMHANVVGFLLVLFSYLYVTAIPDLIFVGILNIICAILAYLNAQLEKQWEDV